MDVIVLGSGTNVPSERAAAGYLVKTDTPFVMDMGYGTFSNLVKAQERSGIGHILFTHMHVDHYSDFIPFLQNAVHESAEKGRKDLEIFAPKGSKEILERLVSLPGLNGNFGITVKEVLDEPFSIGGARIIPKKLRHAGGFGCVGYRIEHSGKALAYSGDTILCREIVELCRNADVAILDCSVPKGFAGQTARHHLGVTGCGLVAKQAGVRKLVLSHIYPACKGHNLAKECREVFGGEIIVAKDLMRFKV